MFLYYQSIKNFQEVGYNKNNMETEKSLPAGRQENNKKAWVVAADMGYGHQRTAFPLRELALGGDIINANNYQGIPRQDRNIWESTRTLYEAIAGFYRIPLIGKPIFGIFDNDF